MYAGDAGGPQLAIIALMPSATNCTASAARMTPSRRVRIERPVWPENAVDALGEQEDQIGEARGRRR